jgi:hypothetical protein
MGIDTGPDLRLRGESVLINFPLGWQILGNSIDYDAEYRYDRMPVDATRGLAPDHVVYALRIGWF